MRHLPATLSVHNDTSEVAGSTGIKHLQFPVCDIIHWHDKFGYRCEESNKDS